MRTSIGNASGGGVDLASFMGRIVTAIGRWVLRVLLAAAILLAALFFVANYAFHHWYPIREKILESVAARSHQYHIHTLSYAQIPPTYRNAIIATEDRRFAWDPGIDPVGILRSIVVDVERDGYVEGGSTITQQVADNTLLNQNKTIVRKLKQVAVAIGIYDTFSKSETLAMYANVIYFGHGAYGLYNAAETYFGRTPLQCNAGELAMLAGIPNAPSSYDPLKHPRLARQRQEIVVDNMVDAGKITSSEAKQILALPLRLKTLHS